MMIVLQYLAFLLLDITEIAKILKSMIISFALKA
jgi:hypothetical protein